jgi:hypothetical protein
MDVLVVESEIRLKEAGKGRADKVDSQRSQYEGSVDINFVQEILQSLETIISIDAQMENE